MHANHEFLEGGTPDATWQIQKLLILEVEAPMRRDPNRDVRLDGLANRNKPPAAPTALVADKLPADKSTDKSTTSKKKGRCRVFKSTGECRIGDTCSFGHAASADAPATATNLPVAVTMQDPEGDQMGVNLEEFTCGADLGPGCTETYKA